MVLGLLMFLIYINDIGDKVSSSLRFFADDCVLYRTVISLEDSKQLQYDLDSILKNICYLIYLYVTIAMYIAI